MSEPTYDIPGLTVTGDVIPGEFFMATVDVTASSPSPSFVNVWIEVRDSTGTPRGMSIIMCHIEGKTHETTNAFIKVDADAPIGPGHVCAKIV